MKDGLEEFCEFAERIRLMDKLPRAGNLPAVIPRILGKGKTRAEGLLADKPPALIERLYEYAKLDFANLGNTINYPIRDGEPIREEQRLAKQKIEDLQKQLERPTDGWELSAREVLWKLGETTPGRDGRYTMGEIELGFDKKTLSWLWSYRGSYPLVSKLPHDTDYICEGYEAAVRKMKEAIVSSTEFVASLKLAWAITKHRAGTNMLLIRDVAKAYMVAAQAKEFWEKPSKTTFSDIPDAVFVINLLHSIDDVKKIFEFAKSNIGETALGGKGKNVSFDLPRPGGGGTEPFTTIRLKE